jgi:hypothetical protein
VEVDVVLALAGSVTQVVEAGSNVFSEAADWMSSQGSLKDR